MVTMFSDWTNPSEMVKQSWKQLLTHLYWVLSCPGGGDGGEAREPAQSPSGISVRKAEQANCFNKTE